MKKQKEDVPLEYFERSYVWITGFLGLSVFLTFSTYKLFSIMNPLGFVLGVPSILSAFQSLWMLLNPYAIIYEDKFEVKRSGLSNKVWHFIDIKKVSEINGRGFVVTYNDDDEELIPTWGIRSSHKQKFRNAVNHYVCKSFVERED